jgi:hypothetical protein
MSSIPRFDALEKTHLPGNRRNRVAVCEPNYGIIETDVSEFLPACALDKFHLSVMPPLGIACAEQEKRSMRQHSVSRYL